jgi:hypothetical protein
MQNTRRIPLLFYSTLIYVSNYIYIIILSRGYRSNILDNPLSDNLYIL